MRSTVWAFAAVGLFFACLSSSAQRAGGEKPSRFMDRIDPEEGAIRIAAFRQQRLDGDYCFRFQLEHKPRRARTVKYDGIMWGSWNEVGPVTRFKLFPADEGEPVELIIQNGVEASAYIRRSDDAPFLPLEGEDLFAPILEDLVYSAFDLQMPFVYWEDYTYEGPVLIGASRVGQQFLMRAPEGSESAGLGVDAVRISLDDTYDALWRVEVMGAEGKPQSRFAVESFKKVQGQYIVKRITLTDYTTKDRTTFHVRAASVGLSFEREIFAPESNVLSPVVTSSSFETL